MSGARTATRLARRGGKGRRAAAAVLGALALLLALTGCGGGRQQVTVMVPWTGGELAAFQGLVADFEQHRPVDVHIEVTRAQDQELTAATEQNLPPDLAVLSDPSALLTLAGDLLPFSDPESTARERQLAQPFLDLGTVTTHGRRQVLGLPIKADVKSLLWYPMPSRDDPGRAAASARRAFAALLDGSASGAARDWCLGLFSGPTSGWPGADWISDFVLNESGGPAAYQRWVRPDGRVDWSEPGLAAALAAWKRLLSSTSGPSPLAAGPDAAAAAMTPGTNGGSAAGAGAAAGASAAACGLDHGALSALGTKVLDGLGGSYGWTLPTANSPALQVSADYLVMVRPPASPGHAAPARPRTAAVTELADWLTDRQEQSHWVGNAGAAGAPLSSALSPYRDVPVTAYPTAARGLAALLDPPAGSPRATLCFSAADVMAPGQATAFYQAVMQSAESRTGLDTGLLGQVGKPVAAAAGAAASASAADSATPYARSVCS